MTATWLVVACRVGNLALTFMAMVFALKAEEMVPGKHKPFELIVIDAHQRVLLMLCGTTIPTGTMLLMFQFYWLYLHARQQQQQEQQHHALQQTKLMGLLVLIGFEWLLSFVTVGTVSCAIFVDLTATELHPVCDMPVCAKYQVVADVMFCTAGVLAAASAVGLMWVLGSLLRQTQA